MSFSKFSVFAGIVGIGLVSLTASAGAVTITMTTANQGGVAFNAVPGDPNFHSGITATINYSGPLSFSNTANQNGNSNGDKNSDFFNPALITSYTGSGTLPSPANANFSTVTTFLASSGSASNYQYGSFLTFDLGTLLAGTVLTITHDDGASVFTNGVQQQPGNTTEGPTTAVTELVTLALTGQTFLYYARENGSPSILNVQISAVPLPTALPLFASGLAGLGWLGRRRRRATARAT